MTQEVPDWIQKQVDKMFADPDFQRDLDRAEAELAAGGGVRYEVKDDGLYRVSDGEPLYRPDDADPEC